MVKGNHIVGAAVVDPQSQTIAIEVKSKHGRHIINKTELAAIYIAIEQNKDRPHLKILTDSAVSINAIRNYIIDSLAYVNHPYKELLHHIDDLIRQRDDLRLLSDISKFKSNTGIKFNDQADHIARDVVDNQMLPQLIYGAADPPIGGLRTWL